MISATNEAILKFKEISEGEGIGHYTVRLKVAGGGCQGFVYDMGFDNNISEMDEVIEQDGVQFIIDPLSAQYLEGVEIDYLDGLMSSGFKFINPSVTSTCGCGSSFNVG